MADVQNKILKTRIQLKYDTLSNWVSNKTKQLLPGEVAAVEILGTSKTIVVGKDAEGNDITKDVQTPPTVLFKVGSYKKDNDGNPTTTLNTFEELPWLSALAADVHEWAKLQWSSDDVNADTFIKRVNTALNNGAATSIGSRLDALETHTDMGKNEDETPIKVKEYVDNAISALAGTKVEGDTTDQTVAGAKLYAAQRVDELLRAYIYDDKVQEKDEDGNPVFDEEGNPVYLPDAIDKLQEIAAWIADDKTGAVKMIADIDALNSAIGEVYTKDEVDELIEVLPIQDTNTTYQFGVPAKDTKENSHVGKFTVKPSDGNLQTIDTGVKEYVDVLDDAMDVRVTAIETNYIRTAATDPSKPNELTMYLGKSKDDEGEPITLIISGGSASDVW